MVSSPIPVPVSAILSCVLLAVGSGVAPAAEKPVKVFVLAGQSNMEGHGFITADPKRNEGKGSLQFLVKNAATADKFKHLVGKDGKWAVRDDVWIHYLGRVDVPQFA
jgi:alpha-galactosidase